MNYQKICVVGLGYIGLPTATMFASKGADVLGADVNPKVIETLKRGEIHIHEPGLAQAFAAVAADGKFNASLQPSPADAFIISVPTPFKHGESGNYNGISYKLADMQAVKSAAESIAPHLRKGNLVILESTSPPRTTLDVVAPILEKSNLKAGVDFHLCYSPERVLPGQILRELVENSRVIGGVTPASAQAGADLYSAFVTGEITQTDATTAEMVKLMENTYRDANIAIANEFSRLADQFGVDVWEAIAIANLHPRVKILNPGPGVGGHCISVDPWFLVESAPQLTPLIYQSRQVNDSQPRFLADVVERALGSLKGKRIAALGLAYKPDVDDLRESPAVAAAQILQERGAQVRAYEPFKPEAQFANLALTPTLEAAVQNADALLLLVKHSQFAALNPEEVAKQTSARIAIDAVQGWDSAAWKRAGFRFVKLGSGKEQ
ncbi:MAG: nucleotide sugar dehydrogenase [Anaerolineales bacterium]|nr:nucleotide sugar dehydrogenase [Anaerolineales bacterium]